MRIEVSASVVASDVFDHTVRDKHLQLILHNRPGLVADWSDQEVARRWLRVKHSTLSVRDEPRQESGDALLADKAKVAAPRRKSS